MFGKFVWKNIRIFEPGFTISQISNQIDAAEW